MKNFLYFAVLTIVVVFAWVGLNIYHSVINSTISQDNAARIIPITSSFDTQTLDLLKTKHKVNVNLSEKKTFLEPTKATEQKSPTQTLPETQVGTNSGQIKTPI